MLLLKKESKISQFLENYTASPWFMLTIGVMTLLAHFLAIDIIAFIILGSLLILTTLFVEDGKPLLVFCCTLWPVVSIKNGATGNGNYDYHYYASQEMITMLIIMCSIAFCAFVFKFIAVKGVSRLLKKRSIITSGILLFSLGLLLNGVDVYSWSTEMTAAGYGSVYNINNLIIGGLEVFIWFCMFFYFRATIKWDKRTVDYLFQAVLTGGLVVLVQFFVRLIEQANAGVLFYEGTHEIDRNVIDLGWGICNNIASYFTVTLPALLYFSATRKRGWIYLVASFVFIFAILLTQCRAAVLVSTVIMIIGVIYICIKAVEKKPVWITTGSAFALVLVLFLVFKDSVLDAFPRIFSGDVFSSGRFEIWKSGLDKFAEAPVFGKGFSDDVYGLTDVMIFHNFYHNEIIQVIATCGIVGFAGLILFKVLITKVIFKRITLNRVFLGITLLTIDLLSMFDSNIFFPFEGVLYTACLAIAHFDFDEMHKLPKSMKPQEVNLNGETAIDEVK